MAAFSLLQILLLVAASVRIALPGDPDMLQDICVADLSSNVKLNGFACKPANAVTSDDFYFGGLADPGPTNNTMGSFVMAGNVEKIPGLNTMGISLSRVDYAAGGLNPPHAHPRATEIIFVLYGSLHVGFITTANQLVARTLKQGDVFVFPRGLLHFQNNVGDHPAAAIAAFNSQLPGTQPAAASLFAASPPLSDDVLSKAFRIGTKEVQKIRGRFTPKST